MSEYMSPELTLLAARSPANRGVWVPEQYASVPQAAVTQDDDAFVNPKYDYSGQHPMPHAAYLDYFTDLDAHRLKIKNPGGRPVEASLHFTDEASKQRELVVVLGGFSDEPPKTSPELASDYSRGLTFKIAAQPNSRGTEMRSGFISRILDAAGHPKPVLTLYRPIVQNAENSRNMSRGDYSSYAGLVEAAIHEAEVHMHGTEGTTTFDTVNFFNLSLGATEGIDIANAMTSRRVGRMVMQELIIGPRSLRDLMSYGGTVLPELPEYHSTEGYVHVPEILARRVMDATGAEIQMYGRMLKAVRRLSLVPGLVNPELRGLTHPEVTRDALERLADSGIPITVALADNSRASHQTRDYLPHTENVKTIRISGAENEPATHIVNENLVLVGTVALLGLAPDSENKAA
jgi:hypothetical protein